MTKEDNNIVALKHASAEGDKPLSLREWNLSLAELMQDGADGLGLRVDQRGRLIVSRGRDQAFGS